MRFKNAIGLLLLLLASSASPNAPWTRYQVPKTSFSFEYPSAWKVGPSVDSPGTIEIATADESVSALVTTFTPKPGSSFEKFTDDTFAFAAERLKPVGPAREMSGIGWKGLLQEAEGTDKDRRLVLVVNGGDRYLSLSLYVDSKEFLANRAYYERMFTSVKVGK
jgi:hypothetical protein